MEKAYLVLFMILEKNFSFLIDIASVHTGQNIDIKSSSLPLALLDPARFNEVFKSIDSLPTVFL